MQRPDERKERVGTRRIDVPPALLVLLDEPGRHLRECRELVPRQSRRLAEFPKPRFGMRRAIPVKSIL